jgi:hypothetical protein
MIVGVGSFKEKKENTGQPVVHLSFCPVSGIPGKQAWRPVTGTLPAARYITLVVTDNNQSRNVIPNNHRCNISDS